MHTIVRCLETGGIKDAQDHKILRRFFDIQDLQELIEYGRPNEDDSKDHISMAIETDVLPISVISAAEAETLKDKRMPCSRFSCSKKDNYVGMCDEQGCPERDSFPKEEWLSDPEAEFVFNTATIEPEPDREVIDLEEEEKK
jgi:hypothetical protein